MISKCVLVFLLLSAQTFSQRLNLDKTVEDDLKKINQIDNSDVVLQRQANGEYVHDYGDDYDPMTSDYAPPEPDQGGTAGKVYSITSQRLGEIRKYFMYPYYDKGGDADNNGDYQEEIQTSSSETVKNLNFHLPFFGSRFNYTRVSLNGYLGFSDPLPDYSQYPLVFPSKDFPEKNDPSFIAIFLSKCRVGNLKEDDIDQRKAGVYFRLEKDLENRTDQMGIEIRERAKWDVREGVIGASNFSPKHVVIVTWKNVSFIGGVVDAIYKTNTFQLVLATDEVFTYAMFNYLNLAWTSHTEAGGDVINGEGGTPAFVGFNAGNGARSWEYIPYSQRSVIRDLTGTGSGNNFEGRHFFRIDENIFLDSCNEEIDGANLDLSFTPQSGNMLGGTIVNMTGPCFNPTDTILCKFDTEDAVYGTVVDSNRAICIQPPMTVEGYVRFEVAIGSGAYKWKGKYYVETPATAAQKIFFGDMTYNEKNPPSEIYIKWDKQNLTQNEDTTVSISLWGYRETGNHSEFLYIDDIASNVQNVGLYAIVPSTFKNRQNDFLDDILFGFIQINLTESISAADSNSSTKIEITPAIWSRPIPLAWYFTWQWERKYGTNWTETFCDNWLENDRLLNDFTSNLTQCPCTLAQALADKGRFMPDPECDKDSNPTCYYHKQTIHCVKSGTPNVQGAEQQCCYDKNEYLMLSHDQEWASYPHRSHNLGYSPWTQATQIPTLSQWYNDISPRFVCCLWQEETSSGCEAFRYKRRPTEDCVAYKSPGIAGVFGDPHIITFDDLEYTFNGIGEFVLLRSQNVSNRLEIQGRFAQMPLNSYGEVKATQLTSIVARGNKTTIVEIRQRPQEARWRYHLDVIVDGRRIYFDEPSLKSQNFPGVTVYTPSYIFNQSEVIVMFDSGAGVEVIENNGYMTARVYLPQTFMNQTRGLFGNWSFNLLDDFTLPDGTITNASTNVNDTKRIYEDFGMKWMLDDVEDPQNPGKGTPLFYREYGRIASYYNNLTFKPEFSLDIDQIIPANRSEYRDKAYTICSSFDYQCLYDYAMTYNDDLAHFTINSKTSITTLKDTTRKKILSCGVLETPRFGRKSTFLFVPGTKVTFECFQNYTLAGDQSRVCLTNGEWNISEYGYTECLPQNATSTYLD